MRNEHYKQMACISETDPQIFEQKTNAILAGLINPEIVLDRVKPFTAYIFYKVRKDVPEDILELFEMLDTADGKRTCSDCPYFKKSTDKRRRKHTCTLTGNMTRADSRACEEYYKAKMQRYRGLLEEYKNIPYTLE